MRIKFKFQLSMATKGSPSDINVHLAINGQKQEPPTIDENGAFECDFAVNERVSLDLIATDGKQQKVMIDQVVHAEVVPNGNITDITCDVEVVADVTEETDNGGFPPSPPDEES